MSKILIRLEQAILVDVADKSNNFTPKVPDADTARAIRKAGFNLRNSPNSADRTAYQDFQDKITQCYNAVWDAPADQQKAILDRILLGAGSAVPVVVPATTSSLTLSPDDASWLKIITLKYFTFGEEYYTGRLADFKIDLASRGVTTTGFDELAARWLSAAQSASPNDAARSAAVDGVAGVTVISTTAPKILGSSKKLSQAEKNVLELKKLKQEESAYEDMDHNVFSVGYDNWQGTSAFGQVIRVTYYNNRAELDPEFARGGYYLQIWVAPGGSDTLENPFNLPVGDTIGGFLRLGWTIPGTQPEVYPSIEFGIGFDPIRTAGGLIVGTVTFPIFGTLVAGFAGFISGLETHVDGGVNIGPVGLRGGLYPCGEITGVDLLQEHKENMTTLQRLNPGVRLEVTF